MLCEGFHQGTGIGEMMGVTTTLAAYRMIALSAVRQPVTRRDGNFTTIAVELALRMRPHSVEMALRAVIFNDKELAILAEVLADTLGRIGDLQLWARRKTSYI